jgi:hypothetical protein
LHIKPKLCQKNKLGYAQDLSMLFSNHTYFLFLGIFQPEWWLACRNVEIEEHIFQKMLFSMPVNIHAKNCLSIKSRGDLKSTWIGLAHSLLHIFCKAVV